MNYEKQARQADQATDEARTRGGGLDSNVRHVCPRCGFFPQDSCPWCLGLGMVEVETLRKYEKAQQEGQARFDMLTLPGMEGTQWS